MTTAIGESLGKTSMETTAAPTIRVEIYNQTYSIRSDGDSEYLMQLADFVDGRMREISSGTLTVDSLKVAILAALQITDELFQAREASYTVVGAMQKLSDEIRPWLPPSKRRD